MFCDLLGSQYGWRWHFSSLLNLSWYSSAAHTLQSGCRQSFLTILFPAEHRGSWSQMYFSSQEILLNSKNLLPGQKTDAEGSIINKAVMFSSNDWMQVSKCNSSNVLRSKVKHYPETQTESKSSEPDGVREGQLSRNGFLSLTLTPLITH